MSAIITSTADMDSIRSLLVQSMDTRSKAVRAAAARTLAASLLSVMGESSSNDSLGEITKQESRKKKVINNIKEDDPEDGRSSPALSKSTPFTIQFRDLLRYLSSSYTSRAGNRQTRAGVMLSYAYVLKSVGGQFTNLNYPTILAHMLHDLVSNPHVMEDRHRSLETRRHVGFLLCNVIRRQLLSEPAKQMALRALMDVLQKGIIVAKGNIPEAEELSVESTVSALNELNGLLQDLGSAISAEQVAWKTQSLLILGIIAGNLSQFHTTLTCPCPGRSIIGLKIIHLSYTKSDRTDVALV